MWVCAMLEDLLLSPSLTSLSRVADAAEAAAARDAEVDDGGKEGGGRSRTTSFLRLTRGILSDLAMMSFCAEKDGGGGGGGVRALPAEG